MAIGCLWTSGQLIEVATKAFFFLLCVVMIGCSWTIDEHGHQGRIYLCCDCRMWVCLFFSQSLGFDPHSKIHLKELSFALSSEWTGQVAVTNSLSHALTATYQQELIFLR